MRKFSWARRHDVRGVRTKWQPWWRETLRRKILISGVGFRRITKSVEEPLLCYKCSWPGSVRLNIRVVFVGKKNVKVKSNLDNVLSLVVVCGGAHNVGSWVCRVWRAAQLHNKGEVQQPKKGGESCFRGDYSPYSWQRVVKGSATECHVEDKMLWCRCCCGSAATGLWGWQILYNFSRLLIQRDIQTLRKMVEDNQKVIARFRGHEIVEGVVNRGDRGWK